jgi:hypothetical protein
MVFGGRLHKMENDRIPVLPNPLIPLAKMATYAIMPSVCNSLLQVSFLLLSSVFDPCPEHGMSLAIT